MMRAGFIFASLIAMAGTAEADYACAFPIHCEMETPCHRDYALTAMLELGQEGWQAKLMSEGVAFPMVLNPEAGTYFAHVFIGVDGYEDGMDASQISIARDGSAFFTVHSMGVKPLATTHIGRCEVVG